MKIVRIASVRPIIADDGRGEWGGRSRSVVGLLTSWVCAAAGAAGPAARARTTSRFFN